MQERQATLTFDQHLKNNAGQVDHATLSPNQVIPGEIVLEPVMHGIRVTGRTDDHRLLWGFVASEGMLTQTVCPIHVYEKLRELIGADLPSSQESSWDNPVESAKRAIQELKMELDKIAKNITTRGNEKDAAWHRARIAWQTVRDMKRFLNQEWSGIQQGNEE